MRRSRRRVVVVAVLAASLLLASPANAHSGDPAPDQSEAAPSGVGVPCSFVAQATAPRTPSGWIGHDQYNLVGFWLCPVGIEIVRYEIDASGGEWGPLQSGMCNGQPGVCEGSSDTQSWSDNSSDSPVAYSNPCGDADVDNKNNIFARNTVSAGSGWVKYVRTGAEMRWWGRFCAGVLAGRSFTAETSWTVSDPADTTSDPVVYDVRGIVYLS